MKNQLEIWILYEKILWEVKKKSIFDFSSIFRVSNFRFDDFLPNVF